ncbi:uracil phosphoribosyltransferase-domain-containing protein [Lentinula edodes]|uniref:uracil phosphoribosyltransferase-domain-containing protein n=1 Tax=Lentinula edodes TaxID=5353 RepID=UPI001E8EB30B|nr:uracil phosphoribosyltransferase-domain-containing protein [Lentinula edodes]KAH7872100.1 uracil phosphoribosyltransferase-domain-containing protein [Lentinula edodes]
MSCHIDNIPTGRIPASVLKKPTVVGLYGVSGCGKSFLLKELKEELGEQEFDYHEGAAVISRLVPGGLSAFQKMEYREKTVWRERAIDQIQEDCTISGRVALVAGHFMFWDEYDKTPQLGWTEHDQTTFTHILYLHVPPDVIAQRRMNDSNRARSSISDEHLRKWQQAECDQLRLVCLEHKILFSIVPPSRHKIAKLLRNFQRNTEEYNLSCARDRLDEVVREVAGPGKLKTTLVMDGDRTLIAEDTGALFWRLFNKTVKDATENTGGGKDPLKELFSGPFGYSYAAFVQAALLYEEVDEKQFDDFCEEVASAVTVHPEFVSLLVQAAECKVGAVIITCGLGLIWEKILKKTGLSETVKVIGGGRIRDHLIITGEVKAALVARLRTAHGMYVCAFGDSVLDLPMLKGASQAIVVVGEERHRSHRMDDALLKAIDDEGLQACQVLLPKTASARLDVVKLPLVSITEGRFLDSLVSRLPCRIHILHATNKNPAKLLMSGMRDARVAGPALREVHRRVGWYLTTEFVSELIGLEEYPIPHVQGPQTQANGHRLRDENRILIVALMRGGEPMALGVSEALPLAPFLHAKYPEDVENRHVEDQKTVILVDSVVNSGKTVVEFVRHIRKLHATIRILVVAGVIQADSLAPGGALAQIPTTEIGFISLRLSDNKFTGKGTTDTGNRLFNTTYLQ